MTILGWAFDKAMPTVQVCSQLTVRNFKEARLAQKRNQVTCTKKRSRKASFFDEQVLNVLAARH